ncbi:MAG: hypothetical protein SFU85_08075 [Candidatus Methylacidiphilales bacterium]|nr:hypothetical protein [Candidatus Methylacidiphilales bacterium]
MTDPMRLPFAALLFLQAALLPCAAQQTATLRISLIHGQNEEITENLVDCQKFRESLAKLFGYARYERLGSSSASLSPGGEADFEPTRAFRMKVRSDAAIPNLFHYELFQEDKHILGGKFIPKDRIPFIIRGPQYNQGILILVVYKDTPGEMPSLPAPAPMTPSAGEPMRATLTEPAPK